MNKVAILPEKPEKKHFDAIYKAWDYYGPTRKFGEKRLLGQPEAERIYRELFKAATSE